MRLQLESSIAILQRTPEVIRHLLQDLSDDWTQADYGPNTWSAHQIVGHLIRGDRTDWMPRARHILERQDQTPFEPFDRAGHEALCGQHTLAELLDEFAGLRDQNLADLRALNLTAEQRSLPGCHPALGSVTLSQLLATWTVHDLNHIAQICKALAYQYQDTVGPWEAYLSILAPPNPR